MDDTSRRVGSGANDVVGDASEDSAADARDSDSVDRRTREIRGEIEETRVELSETIDAIQERLTPRNIVANATDRVKHAATERVRDMADTASQTAQDAMNYTRDMANDVTDRARQNPIPLALIGLGAAWLLSSRSRRGASRGSGMFAQRDWRDGRPYGEEWTRNEGYDLSRERGVMARIRNNPIPTVLAGVGLSWLALSNSEGRDRDYGARSGQLRREGSWTEPPEGATREGDATQNLTDSASRIASRTREYASDATDSMRRMARQRRNQLQRMVQDNPLLVGAGALMLGAAFGMAVPETETENELMGDTRDSMMGRAREMALDAANQVQNAASSVVEAAGEVAGKASNRTT